jgi:membrane protein implicated in regulation of membrane protease activity
LLAALLLAADAFLLFPASLLVLLAFVSDGPVLAALEFAAVLVLLFASLAVALLLVLAQPLRKDARSNTNKLESLTDRVIVVYSNIRGSGN